MCENVAVTLNRILRVTKILLSKNQCARKFSAFLWSGNQPSQSVEFSEQLEFLLFAGENVALKLDTVDSYG